MCSMCFWRVVRLWSWALCVLDVCRRGFVQESRACSVLVWRSFCGVCGALAEGIECGSFCLLLLLRFLSLEEGLLYALSGILSRFSLLLLSQHVLPIIITQIYNNLKYS